MKKVKYLILICFFCMIKNVYAVDDCSTTEMARLRELANNVEIKYDYKVNEYDTGDENEKDLVFIYNLKLSNDNSDLKYYYYLLTADSKKEITPQELESMDFYEGQVINVQIYSWTDNYCTNELLRTIKIKIPVYNRFYHYHKEECEKYIDFKYCKEYLENNLLDIDEIEELFEKYKKNNPVNEASKKNDVNSFIKNNKNYFILGGGVVALLAIITGIIVIVKKRKNSYL